MVEALEKPAPGECGEEKGTAHQAAASNLRSIGVDGAVHVVGILPKGLAGLA